MLNQLKVEGYKLKRFPLLYAALLFNACSGTAF